ncbi:hypothetical protein GZ064_06720 [Wolbachia endosymbiont of Diaphorina citri]|jgi:hypothetical protein|nr:hypothetical protein FK497_01075 [Wolbachia endosymbiont of Diaphorina citri]QXY87498.1 hypothetical protein GZ064_06720 [Wolbachia endosymbiont of Diaphorina citri]QXY88707.1 hypothetical protein GZ065_06760 [Wolbachia endosymbiont of Diaphorina citri]QXY89054.1 hypothetical protein GZ066_01155 [Wolbachia endosymbiont of Diaphorina citri]
MLILYTYKVIIKLIMSRKIVNTLKSQVKELKYADLGAKGLSSSGWYDIYSGNVTYKDLNRCSDITINGQKVTNEFIRELYSKHESLLIRDENKGDNYRPFLKAVFTEMFEHAGAIVPNDSIIEELITNYNQAGYTKFFVNYNLTEMSELGLHLSYNDGRAFCMNCNDPDCLEFSFCMESIPVSNTIEYVNAGGNCLLYKVCDLSSSVEFNLKCKGENVTYEDGKVLLTIPKELEDYKAGDDSLLDKLTDIINKLVEYFKKLCERLGLKFDTRIEYDSERNIKIEHKLGKPLQVIDEPDVYAVNGLKCKAQ